MRLAGSYGHAGAAARRTLLLVTIGAAVLLTQGLGTAYGASWPADYSCSIERLSIVPDTASHFTWSTSGLGMANDFDVTGSGTAYCGSAGQEKQLASVVFGMAAGPNPHNANRASLYDCDNGVSSIGGSFQVTDVSGAIYTIPIAIHWPEPPQSSVSPALVSTVPADEFALAAGVLAFAPDTASRCAGDSIAKLELKGGAVAQEPTEEGRADGHVSPGCGTSATSTTTPYPGGGAVSQALAASEAPGAPELPDPSPWYELLQQAIANLPLEESPDVPDQDSVCGDQDLRIRAAYHRSYSCTITGRVYTPELSPSGTLLSGKSAPFCEYASPGLTAYHKVCIQRLDFAGRSDKTTWSLIEGTCRLRRYSAARGETADMTRTTTNRCRGAVGTAG
jgi:hypothetical protein